MDNELLITAIAAIDALHAEDPRTVEFDGRRLPAELLYAERMTNCLLWLEPTASEALQLAVRAQHLRRWRLPREAYEMNRVGYLKWRTELKRLHAEELGGVLKTAGYTDVIIARAQSLVKKERLKSDADAQLLEDVVCLVFLQYEAAEFAAKHEDEKVVDILRKTWPKMSERARGIALQLPLPERLCKLIAVALDDSADSTTTEQPVE